MFQFQDYLDVNLFYIDNSFNHHARAVACKPLPLERHTALFVLEQFAEVLNEYNIPESHLITTISNQGSNMVGVEGLSSRFGHYDCLCHLLSTIIRHVLVKKKLYDAEGKSYQGFQYYNNAPSIFKLIDKAHRLVDHFKRAG